MAAARMFALATGAETMSTISSTPRPPVAASTSSGQFSRLLSTARVAPNAARLARRAGLVDVPMTSPAPR